MTLISQFTAASCSEEELRGLLRQSFNSVAVATVGSQEHRTALLSIKTIESELTSRVLGR